jgi:hypothetical protein
MPKTLPFIDPFKAISIQISTIMSCRHLPLLTRIAVKRDVDMEGVGETEPAYINRRMPKTLPLIDPFKAISIQIPAINVHGG